MLQFFSAARSYRASSVLGFLVVGIIGQIVNNGNAGTGPTATLSLLFPSMNYMFMLVPVVEQDVETVMGKVGLTQYASHLASKHSGGNKRKLSLAIALIGTRDSKFFEHES